MNAQNGPVCETQKSNPLEADGFFISDLPRRASDLRIPPTERDCVKTRTAVAMRSEPSRGSVGYVALQHSRCPNGDLSDTGGSWSARLTRRYPVSGLTPFGK